MISRSLGELAHAKTRPVRDRKMQQINTDMTRAIADFDKEMQKCVTKAITGLGTVFQ
jgi:hypothetical protein